MFIKHSHLDFSHNVDLRIKTIIRTLNEGIIHHFKHKNSSLVSYAQSPKQIMERLKMVYNISIHHTIYCGLMGGIENIILQLHICTDTLLKIPSLRCSRTDPQIPKKSFRSKYNINNFFNFKFNGIYLISNLFKLIISLIIF